MNQTEQISVRVERGEDRIFFQSETGAFQKDWQTRLIYLIDFIKKELGAGFVHIHAYESETIGGLRLECINYDDAFVNEIKADCQLLAAETYIDNLNRRGDSYFAPYWTTKKLSDALKG